MSEDSPASAVRQRAGAKKSPSDEDEVHSSQGIGRSTSVGSTSSESSAHSEDYLGKHSGKHEVHRLRELVHKLTAQLRDAKEAKKSHDKDYSPSKNIHVLSKPSPLSSDATTAPDFKGMFNLVIIVAVVTNVRVIIENLLKYGVLVGSFRYPETRFSLLGLAVFAAVMLLNVVVAFVAEKMCSSGTRASASIGTAVHVINCLSPIVTSLAIPWAFDIGALVSIYVAMGGLVVHMKLVSYAHTNHDMRLNKKHDYPANITPKNLGMFMLFPTLVYQASYPRTSRIRKTWVAKRLFQFIVCLSLMAVIMEQFLVPTMMHSTQHLRDANFPKIMERLLKTAIPSLMLWLLMFWGMFELWLNIVAELTYFGDREFYLDWWNSRSLDTYWRKWNRPVHHWMLRHLFFPMLSVGIPKPVASTLVFVWSAALHEYVVSGPFRTLEFWAFIGMMSQIPLISFTSALDRMLRGTGFENMGNVVFWVTFCFVGQPLCLLLYYQDLSKGEPTV